MKTIAVTGATGFIGQRVVAAAVKEGWRLRILARNDVTITLPPDVPVFHWDMEAGDPPAACLKDVDAICHMAAFIPGDFNSAALAERCLRTNALGTLTLLKAAYDSKVGRFVYLSSGNAYRASDTPVTETSQIYPTSRATYYLASKLAAELYVDHWDRAGKLSACILRLSSVYGPGMPNAGLVPYLARGIRDSQTVTLRGGGTYGSDLVFVDDVVAAAMGALASPVRGPVNIGSGNRTTSSELADVLLGILGRPPELVITEPAALNPDLGFAALDISRANRHLGFVPTQLREGLSRYLASLADRTPDEAIRRTVAN